MLASTLESQRVFYQESLQEIEFSAKTLLERKQNEIHVLEHSLQQQDERIEQQLVRLDEAREHHEIARREFGDCLTKSFAIKKEN